MYPGSSSRWTSSLILDIYEYYSMDRIRNKTMRTKMGLKKDIL
jgi:hypothetical protein